MYLVSFLLLGSWWSIGASVDLSTVTCYVLAENASSQVTLECQVLSNCDSPNGPQQSSLSAYDAFVTPVNDGMGFNITWKYQSNNGSLSSGTIFQLRKQSSSGSLPLECRTIIINSSSSNVRLQSMVVIVEYEWLNSSPANNFQATYNVSLYSFAMWSDNSAVADFEATVYIQKDDKYYKPSVALWQSQICTKNDVSITFTLGKYLYYDVALCTPPETQDYCNYETFLNAPQKTHVFRNVTAGTYGLLIAPYTPENLKNDPQYCFCSENCICGNSVTLPYDVLDVPGAWTGPVFAKQVLSSSAGEDCVLVNFSAAKYSYGFDQYSLTLIDNTTLAILSSSVINFVSTHATRDVQDIICYARQASQTPASLNVEVTPLGGCSMLVTTVTANVTPLNITSSPPSFASSSSVYNKLTVGDTIGIVVGCAVVALVVILLVTARFRSWPPFSHEKDNLPQDTKGHDNTTYLSMDRGSVVLFGGASSEVLLLYASDHDYHMKVIESFAEILQEFGCCTVILDKWCNPEEVQKNDWLHRQLNRVSKVIIVNSEGAYKLRKAFLCKQLYRKYSNKFATFHHLSETLSVAENYPAIRQKLLAVAFEYTDDAHMLSEVQKPVHLLFSDICQLVGSLHNADTPFEWSCRAHFEQSAKLRKAKKLIRKMHQVVKDKHASFDTTFGPPEERFDSGISIRLNDSSSGMTDSVTIDTPFDHILCSQIDGTMYEGFSTNVPHVATSTLRTDFPQTEEIWNTYLAPEPSIAGSIGSEHLRLALQRLNSEQYEYTTADIPVGEDPQHVYEQLDDSQSDTSSASCVTVGFSTSISLPQSRMNSHSLSNGTVQASAR